MADALVPRAMPFGPSPRPKEPLRVGVMLLGLALAAALGGASGVIWHWLAGDDTPAAEDAASAEPEGEESETPTPTPTPSATIALPQPSPGAG